MVIKCDGMKKKLIKKIKGFSLVELIVAIGIFSLLASSVVYVFTTSYKNFFGVGDKQVLAQFTQEGMEAVRNIRNNGWQTIVNAADGSPRGVQNTNGTWQFNGTSNSLNGLTRVVVVSAVQRDGTGAIVASGGIDDPDTKKVTVTVSGTGIADYVLNTYYTNWSTKTWEQTDWSGTSPREFWSNVTMASSSYSNISTSTAGQVKLKLVASAYNTPGSLVSSIYDLASTDKVLTSLNVVQNVPSGCSLTLTLEGSSSTSFTSYTSNAFANNSTGNFTSSTPSSLNGLRYIRYRLALTACNSNTQTPILYSMSLNYR